MERKGNMEYRLTTACSQEEEAEIHGELRKYNRSKREPSRDIPLGIFYETDEGRKKAGLTGEIFGNWLSIHYLWVSEEYRGQGIGSHLLVLAEQEAVAQGAKYAFVDTFDFQAPEFYKKHGYREVFRLREYPYTGARYYYTKPLTEGEKWDGEFRQF